MLYFWKYRKHRFDTVKIAVQTFFVHFIGFLNFFLSKNLHHLSWFLLKNATVSQDEKNERHQ